MAVRESTAVLPHTCVTCGAVFTPIKFRKAEGVFRAYTGRQNCSAECAFKAKSAITKRRMAETRDRWVGSANPMWTGRCLKNKSYRGPDWSATAEKARKRDGYKCMNCGMSAHDHQAKWAQALEVHHIIPFTEFTDYRKANRPSNLITLCKSCHMTADRAIRQRQLMLDLGRGQRLKPRDGLSRGSRNGRAQIDEATVADIKRRLLAKERQADIAASYGIKTCVVMAISRGQTWRHVPWPAL